MFAFMELRATSLVTNVPSLLESELMSYLSADISEPQPPSHISLLSRAQHRGLIHAVRRKKCPSFLSVCYGPGAVRVNQHV